MQQPDPIPRPSPGPAPFTGHVIVVVIRSGGIAGMTRRWRVEPEPRDAPDWIALIDECPWDDDSDAAGGADRYVWRIIVERGQDSSREAEVPDSRLDGPWRVLVDRVRESDPSRSPGRRPRA